MERPRVVVITDEAEFFGALTAHWSRERNMPILVRKSAKDCSSERFDLAVVGGLIGPATPALDLLRGLRKTVIHVSRSNAGTKLTGVVLLPQIAEWPALVITVAEQIFERQRATAEVAALLDKNSSLEGQSVLGQYMTDMRHNYNNALTSILGNCDLILLDAHQLPSAMKTQVETIRNMAMRLNEVFQRFSSLQKEMQLQEQQRKASASTAGL